MCLGEADFDVGRPIYNRISSEPNSGYGNKAFDGVETTCSLTLLEIEPWYMVWLNRRYEVTRLVINISDAKQGKQNSESYMSTRVLLKVKENEKKIMFS